MNRRQKIIVSVTGIFIVLLALVGLTYAYFVTQIDGNENTKSISVTTANLILEYTDGNGILQTGKLEPSNNYITFLDGEGNEHESKIFTVTNNGNETVEGYKVYLENVQNQLERKDDLVYTLTCKSYTKYGETDQVESGTCEGVSTETTFPSVITNIVSNDIAVGITHEYELKAKYKEMGVDQSIDMNKVISAKINIADAKTKFLAREIIDNAPLTITADKANYINPSEQDGESYTIPAEQANKVEERVLTYTMDDYGTSYYFRGNVENNYVTFANMCWRIVRIKGNGSIKLILEDKDNTCEEMSKMTSTLENFNDDKGDFDIANKLYGGYHDADYLGYKGGVADEFLSYQTTLAKKIDFTIGDSPTAEQVKNTLASKLEVGDWCNTEGIRYDVDYQTILTQEQVDEKIANREPFYYDSYVRLIGRNPKEPTLKCNGVKMNKFRDNTDMYVGTLTADEIVYAGGGLQDLNYYLFNDYQNIGYPKLDYRVGWWTLSHASFTDPNDSFNIFVIHGDGAFVRYNPEDIDFALRPSVTLLSSTTIKVGGVGTIDDPYVIE